MKLFTKGLLLVAIPGLFELGLLAILSKSQSNATQAEAWLLHTKNVIIEAGKVRDPILEESIRMRTGIIFGDPNGLDKTDLWERVDKELAQLRELVRDNPEQLDNADKIHEAVQSYRDWTLEEISLLNNKQNAELITLLRDPASGRYIEKIRNLLQSFIDYEQALDVVRQREAERARQFQNIALILSLLGSLLAAAVAAHIFSRDVGGRLAVLTMNAYRLSKLEQLAQQVAGNDEIAALDKVLHQASQRLLQAKEVEGKYRDELEWRTRELTVLNQDLHSQTQDNEMFIYSVSHDLRSPLVNLKGFSKELQQSITELRTLIDASELSVEQQQQIRNILEQDMIVSLNFIGTAVTRSALIIDAMLRLSRVGRVEYQSRQVNVDETVRRVIDAMSSTIRQRQARVQALSLPVCYGDATAVEQIFGNLIGNAVNYLDPGRPGQIEIGVLPAQADHPDLHTYYVKDNGLGIAPRYIAKIFSGFHRIHADLAQGEGVGLALIKRIVLRHGGKIWVESVEGVGSTFYVALPAGLTAPRSSVSAQGEQYYASN